MKLNYLARCVFNLEYLDNTITKLRLEINTLRAYAEQDYGTVRMLQMDMQVALPTNPIKPRRNLILTLCLVSGLFLGVLIVLISMATGGSQSS